MKPPDLTVSNWRIIQRLYGGFVELADGRLRNIRLPNKHFKALELVAKTKRFGARARMMDDSLVKAVGNWLNTAEFGAFRNPNRANPYDKDKKNRELWQRFEAEIKKLGRDKYTLSEAIADTEQQTHHLTDEIGAGQSQEFTPQDGDERALIERQIRERRGQQSFRNGLRKRYGDRCLVTGCKVLAVLEAAHIKPYQGEKENHPENGLLLRADIHTLFDLDLLGIEPQQLRIKLHPSLATDYENVAGGKLLCPPNCRPSRNALKLRYVRFQERIHQE